MQYENAKVTSIKKIQLKIFISVVILVIILNFLSNTSQDTARRVEEIATPKTIEIIKEVACPAPHRGYVWSCAYFGFTKQDLFWITLTLALLLIGYKNDKKTWQIWNFLKR